MTITEDVQNTKEEIQNIKDWVVREMDTFLNYEEFIERTKKDLKELFKLNYKLFILEKYV